MRGDDTQAGSRPTLRATIASEASNLHQAFAGGEFPHPDGAVPTAAHDPGAVRGDGQRSYRAGVAGKGEPLGPTPSEAESPQPGASGSSPWSGGRERSLPPAGNGRNGLGTYARPGLGAARRVTGEFAEEDFPELKG